MEDLTAQYDRLYRYTQNRVRSIIANYVRSIHDADDLRQKVFLEFIESHGKGPVDWNRAPRRIYALAKYRALDHLRSLERSKEESGDFAEIESDQGQGNRMRAHFEAALTRLTLEDQEVLRLKIYDELKQPQIADKLGISPQAAQRRIAKARRNFLDELRKAGVIK